MIRWTRAVAIYTRGLVIVGAIAAIVALFTFWAVQGQLNEMRAEKRPWINVDVVPTNKIDDENGSLLIQIALKNSGDAAATSIWAEAHLYPAQSGADRKDYHIPYLDCGTESAGIGSGMALFPQESLEKNYIAFGPANSTPKVLPNDKFRWGRLIVCIAYSAADHPDADYVTGKFYLIEPSSDGPLGIHLTAVNTYAR